MLPLADCVLSIITSFIFLFSFSLIYPYLLSPLRRIPGPTFFEGHPIWGAYPSILRSEAGVLQRKWALRYGKVGRAVGPLGVERLVFTSANALKAILVDQHTHFEKPEFVQQILGLTTGSRGLLAATGTEHKALRTLLSPAFAPSNVLEMQSIFYDHAETLVGRIKAVLQSDSCLEGSSSEEANVRSGKVIHVYEWMSRLALDNISSTAFGRSTLSQNIDQLAEAYHRVLSLQSGTNITKFIVLLQIPAMYDFLRSEVCWRIVKWCQNWVRRWLPAVDPICVTVSSMRTIHTIARQVLDEHLVSGSDCSDDLSSSRPTKQKDFMSMLVSSKTTGPLNFMDKECMVDQVVAFLGAGHETIAGALSWTLWLLASHPLAQETLRGEISSLLQKGSRPSNAQLNSLPYLNAVIYESLRLYPPIPTSFREAIRDTYVDGTFVPKGTLIYIGIRVVNTLPEYWGPDSEVFRPERWLTYQSDGAAVFDLNKPTGAGNQFAFQSFLSGSHACLGKFMAMLQMKSVLVTLLNTLEVAPAYTGQQAVPTAAVTMTPKDGLPLTIRLVDHSLS